MPCHQPPLPPPPSWNRGRARGGGGDSPPAPFHGSISFGYPTTSKPKPPKQSRPPTHVIAPFSTPLNIRCLALFKEKAHTSDIYTRNHTHTAQRTHWFPTTRDQFLLKKSTTAPPRSRLLAWLTSAWWRQLSALGRWFIHAIHGGQEGGHRHRQWQKDRGEKVKTWFPRNRAFNQTISCSELCLYSLVPGGNCRTKNTAETATKES